MRRPAAIGAAIVTPSLPVVSYADGTHRVVAPLDTLARIKPMLAEMGITRAANITDLDRLGIPTWCAIRPICKHVQVSNGKGITHAAAKVGALMEAIEHWHAETPLGEFRRASMAELERECQPFLAPTALPDFSTEVPHYLTPQRVIDWIRGERVAPPMPPTPVWLPVCAAYVVEPMLADYSTNGLASGNHPVEATLHALYEIIERDAMAGLLHGGLTLPRGESRVVDLDTLPAGPLAALRDRLVGAGIAMTLVRVSSSVPVSTFWAAFVDPASPAACTSVNIGHGTHLNPTVAAIRAITEAAQARLTFIHGAREDLTPEAYEFSDVHKRLRSFFEAQRGDLAWSAIVDRSSGDLAQDLRTVLGDLRTAGHGDVYRIDLTNPRFGIPVVKMFVPGMVHRPMHY
jgi:ribosomal protein S12 methylthiotransferase accessory factor